MQVHGRPRGFGVHIDDEVSIRSKERHLPVRVTVSAVCICFDKFAYC
jgi:hypothetical protein